MYIFQGVHGFIYVYRNSVNKRNIICKLLRRFIGIVFFLCVVKAVQVDAFKSEEINMSCRSDNLKTGVARAPHRSLLKALGFVRRRNGQTSHWYCKLFQRDYPWSRRPEKYCTSRKRRHPQRRCVPIEFNTIGICDGLAMNHIGNEILLGYTQYHC